jgi:hypothetical protein
MVVVVVVVERILADLIPSDMHLAVFLKLFIIRSPIIKFSQKKLIFYQLITESFI